MSKAVKAVGKVFKSVGTAIKKVVKSAVFKWVAIAAAVYFTAGAAMGAFGALSAEAAIGATTVEGITAAGAAGAGVAGEAASLAALEGASTVGGGLAGGAGALEGAGALTAGSGGPGIIGSMGGNVGQAAITGAEGMATGAAQGMTPATTGYSGMADAIKSLGDKLTAAAEKAGGKTLWGNVALGAASAAGNMLAQKNAIEAKQSWDKQMAAQPNMGGWIQPAGVNASGTQAPAAVASLDASDPNKKYPQTEQKYRSIVSAARG
jgi:type IV secretion system protein TrbL